jgi:hypothetical protein
MQNLFAAVLSEHHDGDLGQSDAAHLRRRSFACSVAGGDPLVHRPLS